MPSANPKLEKQVSTEAVEPIRQALIVIEHRIRNLEKRKGKLESYRNIQKNGGELNADQKTAVEKFEEVQQSLEITRDMYKQIVSIANDAAKQQKKLARKEALERMQQDISKVREVLVIQETFSSISDKKIREDFLSGVNGAVRLTEEEIKYLEDINHETLIKPQGQDNLTLLQQAQKVAEHYIAILDGKQREIVGTTYSKIKEIVYTIIKSGYFDKIQAEISVHEVKHAIDEVCVNELPVTKETKETYCRSDSHIPPSESLLPMPNFSAPISPNSGVSVPSSIQDHVSTQQLVTSSNVSSVENFYSNKSAYVSQPQTQQQQSILQSSHSLPHAPRINDVIGTPNFFFLQESELDTPEVTTQSAISHISTTVNAPIPSQTFTNQSFVSAAVVPQQVIFQHQSQHELSHLTGFNSSNPPPPIPMPPSHQNNIQFNSQHSGFQQQQCQNHTYEQLSHQESVNQLINENKLENLHEVCNSEGSINQTMDSNEWGQVTEPGSNDWGPSDSSLSNIQDTMIQNQNPQQAWGDQSRSNYRNRGGRRGNSNSFNNRSRGGYQSNNRGTFYRGDSSYPNGYQRNWNSTENSGFNSGFKRNGNSRGAPRGSTDRGNRSQFRGSHRSLSRANYVTRNKIQAQN